MGERGEGERAALTAALERARAAASAGNGAAVGEPAAARGSAPGHAGGAEGRRSRVGGVDAAGSAGAGDSASEDGAPPLSVSAAMALAKGALEGVVVRLVGEVSEVSCKPGYKAAYFTVKDKGAALPCMMWNSRYEKSGVRLAVGQLVELTGRFTLYAAKGRMNFDVFSVALAGEGRLRQQVAELARRLEAEGLMNPERRQPVPAFPLAVGLVTSPRGAAVHDVLRTLRRRFPVARVLLAGVPVEGPRASAGIVEGMRQVLRGGAEVILVVRGGGSFEDLMPFNDEGLARAISKCPVPVVTGIGHEPDTSIADMVADLRCSTPTAAAEAVSPARESLAHLFEARKRSLSACAGRAVERAAADVRRCATRPVLRDANLLFAAEAQGLDLAAERLFRALPANLSRDAERLARGRERLARVMPERVERERACAERRADRLASAGAALVGRFQQQAGLAAARLHDLSPLAVLGRGYAIARTPAGAVVKRVGDAPPGSAVDVAVSDGVLACRVERARRIETDIIDWEDAS